MDSGATCSAYAPDPGPLRFKDDALSAFQAVYYRSPEGHEPARDVLDALADDAQAAIDNQIDRLNLLSDEVPHLPFPHSSQVEGSCANFAATTVASSTASSTAARIGS